MSGAFWFYAWCVFGVLLIVGSTVGAIIMTRNGGGFCLDCTDGVHKACGKCECCAGVTA